MTASSGKGSRRKGARAEVAVATWLRAHGFPYAERRLVGTEGSDITGTPGIAWEVKNTAGTSLGAHSDQAQGQRAPLRDRWGILVVKRAGTTDVGRWHAVVPMAVMVDLLAQAGEIDWDQTPPRTGPPPIDTPKDTQ